MVTRGRTEEELAERRRARHEARASHTYRGFINELTGVTGFSADEAERAALAVLGLIEQRITAGEWDDLEAQLPFKLRELLEASSHGGGEQPRRFGRAELVAEVAEALGLGEREAEHTAHCVMAVVRERITPGEAEDVAGQLPADIAELWRSPLS